MAYIALIEKNAYNRELEMPDDKDIVVCGDSQTAYSLNPEYWEGLFNYGLQGLLPWQRYLVVSDILHKNPNKVKYLILDAVPYQMCQPPDPSSNLYYLLRLWHWQDSICNRESDWITKGLDFYRRYGFKKLSRALKWKNLRSNRYKSCLRGSFIRVHVCHFDPKDPMQVRRMKRNIDSRISKFNEAKSFNERDFMDLERLVDYAQRGGVRVVLTTTPLHPLQRLAQDSVKTAEFFKRIQGLVERKGIPYINCYDWEFPDDEWANVNHLNLKGSKPFTLRFKDEFEKIKMQ